MVGFFLELLEDMPGCNTISSRKLSFSLGTRESDTTDIKELN
jgi:hypothetical protein